MKRLNISLLLLIASIFFLSGCNKSIISDNDLLLFGVNTENIDKIEMIHGNKIIYPHKKQSDNLTLIQDLNTAFINTANRMEILDEELSITLTDAEGYAQNNYENYFVYITFTNPQTIRYKINSNDEISNCDSLLFDINNKRLHWSEEDNFEGVLGYADNTTNFENEFIIFFDQLERIFADLRN